MFKKTLKIIMVVAIAFAALIVLVGAMSWYARGPVRKYEAKMLSSVGKTETEILKEFGNPQHIITASELGGRTVDYPWKGMNYVPVPNNPVRSKVLLYAKLNFAFYVYINEAGVVEHVAVAAT